MSAAYMNAVELEGLVDIAVQRTHVLYLAGASTALAVVDSISCFPDEVNLLWSSSWGLVKVLYLLVRYGMFVPAVLSIIYSKATSATPSSCQMWFDATAVTIVVGIAVAKALLYIRVFALYGRGKVVGVVLGCLFAGIHAGMFSSMIVFLGTLEYAPSPIPEVFPCHPIKARPTIHATVYIMVLISELVIVWATMWICITKYRASNSPLVGLFYRDGLGYFLVLSLISAGNILCHYTAPLPYIFLLAIPQCMLNGILSTRMTLHLRKAGTCTEVISEEMTMTYFKTTSGTPYDPSSPIKPLAFHQSHDTDRSRSFA